MSDRVTIEVTGLSAKVRNAIADSQEPNAAAIAEQLFSDVQEDDLLLGLRLVVERTARSMRREALRAAEADVEASEARERVIEKREEAADQLAEIKKTHEQMVANRFFATWKETPTGRKFLGECTAIDLRWSGERHEARSVQSLKAAERDRRLAAAMEHASVVTVRDLGYERASRALTGNA